MNAANQELGARIVELAHQRRRFGYRRIHDLLSREHHKGRTVVDYAVAEGTQTVSIIGVFYGGRHHGRALSAAYDEPGWLVVAGDERARHVRVDHLAVQAGGDEWLHEGVHHEVWVDGAELGGRDAPLDRLPDCRAGRGHYLVDPEVRQYWKWWTSVNTSLTTPPTGPSINADRQAITTL